MLEITSDTFKTIENCEICLVDFYSTICGPCKLLKKTLEHEDLAKVNIFSINVDNNSKLAAEFNIRSVPTLLLFKKGKVQDQLIGKLTLPNIKKFIKQT